MKTQTISFNSFMDGSYKQPKKKERKKKSGFNKKKLAAVSVPPLLAVKTAVAHAAGPTSTSDYVSLVASSQAVAASAQAVPVGAVGDYLTEKTLSAIAHAFDPIIQLLTAVSFPVCSVIIIGSFFFLALGNSEKCWTMVMNSSLAFVLIQLSPLFLNVLKQIGGAV